MTTSNGSIVTVFRRVLSTKELVDAGMAYVLIGLIAGLYTGNDYWLFGALVILVITMSVPRILQVPARCWFGFSLLIGTVMSTLILSFVFFGIVTPLAYLRRFLGHDLMKLKQWGKGHESFFETRTHTYKKEDLDRLF